MEDRGYEVSSVRDRWIKFVKSDESGKDAYVRPTAVTAIVIDDPVTPSVSVYAGLMTATRRGQQPELKDVVIEVEGDEATQVIEWAEKNAGIIITGSWTLRAPA